MWKSGDRASALFDKVKKMPSPMHSASPTGIHTYSGPGTRKSPSRRTSTDSVNLSRSGRQKTPETTRQHHHDHQLNHQLPVEDTTRLGSSSSTQHCSSMTTAMKEQTLHLNPGDHCFVMRSDQTKHPVEVVESRPTLTGGLEYYVHFEGLNRRLDEWVGPERISMENSSKARVLRLGSKSAGSDRTDTPTSDSNDQMTDAESRKLTRNQKRKHEEVSTLAKHKNTIEQSCDDSSSALALNSVAALDPRIAELEQEHEALTKVKYIKSIQLGKWEINTWYFSPYPEEYGKLAKLWICEFCLKYMKFEATYRHHLGVCNHRTPPGQEIYRTDGGLSVYEIDGREHKLYCQNLCLLAKLFLDHKTLYYDMGPFIFYMLAERDSDGSHPVGYFSKERESAEGNNLACIMILPPHQRCGYGKFLIDFSYQLSKIEKIVGSPEKPLSDLGSVSYLSYWTYTLISRLRSMPLNTLVTVDKLSEKTAIAPVDIIETLDMLGLIRYWRDTRVIRVTHKLLDEIIQNSPYYTAPRLAVDRKLLNWTPKPRAVTPTPGGVGPPHGKTIVKDLSAIQNPTIHFGKGKKLRKI